MSQRAPDKSAATQKRTKVTFNKRLAVVREKKADNGGLDFLTIEEIQEALDCSDDKTLDSIRAAVETGKDGYIARDGKTGTFKVMSDIELLELQKSGRAGLADALGQQLVTENDESPESSLLSTQIFRKLVGTDT